MPTLSSIIPPINLSSVSGTLPVANGGTGATTFTANNVLLGNGTSALQAVAPGASGNILTSNGTTWTSAAPEVTLNGIQTLTNKTIAFASNTLTGVAPLASPTFTGTVTTATADLLGSVRGNVTAVAASAIDCSLGNYFTKTASGALTWTVTNVPSSRSYSFLLELTNGGTGTQTWFSGIKWPGGTAPTLTTSGVDVLGFITDDGGTTWRGVQLMKDSK